MILRVLVATAAFALITFVGVDLITPDRPVTTVETISLELDEQPNLDDPSKRKPSDNTAGDQGPKRGDASDDDDVDDGDDADDADDADDLDDD